MPQFFVTSKDIKDKRCLLKGDDVYHLKRVRRIKIDDPIILRTDTGIFYETVVSNVGEDTIEVAIIGQKDPLEAKCNVILCMSLLKGKNFDLAIQKATEVGVAGIIPIKTERTVPLVKEKESIKIMRWSRIVHEAAKQSMRQQMPALEDVLTFSELLEKPFRGTKILAHPESDETFRSYFTKSDGINEIMLLIGPEGGFSDKELEDASRSGWNILSSGKNQLRAETAAIVLPALILYEMELNGENSG